jgi:hypothetical protein
MQDYGGYEFPLEHWVTHLYVNFLKTARGIFRSLQGAYLPLRRTTQFALRCLLQPRLQDGLGTRNGLLLRTGGDEAILRERSKAKGVRNTPDGNGS